MTDIAPNELAAFHRRFHFLGGRLLRWEVRNYSRRMDVSVVLTARTKIVQLGDEVRPVVLRLTLGEVSEYRFLRRPFATIARLREFHLLHRDGQFFLNLDSLGLEPQESPQLFELRSSDAFAAGTLLSWKEIVKRHDS